MHYRHLLYAFFYFTISISISESFVSIKSTTNLRAGPGKQYPINWTLTIQNMPVKMLEKGEVYSKVELYDGTVGWIWNATISNKKSLIVLEDSYIYDKNKNKIALVKKNTILDKLKCKELIYQVKSCKVSVSNIKGYINETRVWGADK